MDVDENGYVLITEGHHESDMERVRLFGPDLRFHHDVGYFQDPEDRLDLVFVNQGTLCWISTDNGTSCILKCVDLWRTRWAKTNYAKPETFNYGRISDDGSATE
jgi:hypothetical protein